MKEFDSEIKNVIEVLKNKGTILYPTDTIWGIGCDATSPEAIEKGVDGFFEIGAFLDNGLKQQTEFDLEAFELATGRTLTDAERTEFIDVQLQANRWTFIGSGMVHPKFLETIEKLGAVHKKRMVDAAPLFC